MTYRYLSSCLGLLLCLMLLVRVPWAHSEELDCLIEPSVTVKVSSAVPGLLETGDGGSWRLREKRPGACHAGVQR